MVVWGRSKTTETKATKTTNIPPSVERPNTTTPYSAEQVSGRQFVIYRNRKERVHQPTKTENHRNPTVTEDGQHVDNDWNHRPVTEESQPKNP